MPKYIYAGRHQAEEHMDRQYDPLTNPLSEPESDESLQDCPEESVPLSLDDFYDLLMEQQEQM